MTSRCDSDSFGSSICTATEYVAVMKLSTDIHLYTLTDCLLKIIQDSMITRSRVKSGKAGVFICNGAGGRLCIE